MPGDPWVILPTYDEAASVAAVVPVDLLGRAVQASRTERTLPREWNDWFTRAAMPMLRVPDFNMSSVSPAS